MDRVCMVCCTRTRVAFDNKKIFLTPSSHLPGGWHPDTLKFPMKMGFSDTNTSSGFSEKAPSTSLPWSVVCNTSHQCYTPWPLLWPWSTSSYPNPSPKCLSYSLIHRQLHPLPCLFLLKGLSPPIAALQLHRLSHHGIGTPVMLQHHDHMLSSHPSCSTCRLCAGMHTPCRWVSFCLVLTSLSSAFFPKMPPCAFAFCPCHTIFSLHSRL